MQVLLSTAATGAGEAGPTQYELVARRGVDVQIIELTSRLERDAIKVGSAPHDAIMRCFWP